jgi:hypothetical protein
MLTKEVVIDRVEVTELGAVQVRRATWILEDGVRMGAPNYHRVAYEPGAAIADEAPLVRAIAGVVWTPEVIAAHQARKAAAAARQ